MRRFHKVSTHNVFVLRHLIIPKLLFPFYSSSQVCRPPKARVHLPLALFLVCYAVIATIVYIIIKAPVLFHCIYGITVVITILKVWR